MTFPQAPALPEELDKRMRRMRLPYMRKAAPDVLATARAQRWDPAEVLRLTTSTRAATCSSFSQRGQHAARTVRRTGTAALVHRRTRLHARPRYGAAHRPNAVATGVGPTGPRPAGRGERKRLR